MDVSALCPRCLPVFFMGLAAVSSMSAASDLPPNYEPQTWRTENGLPQNSVHSIAQTNDGYIWLATEGGLARFDGLKFTVSDTDNTPELKDNHIRSLLVTNDNSLWIATANGLTRLRNGKFTAFATEQGLPGNNILTLAKDSQGELWVGTTEGSAILKNGRFVRKAGDRESIPAGLVNPNIQTRLVDRFGRLWIGTPDGLFIYQNGQATKVNLHQPAAGLILSFFEDREGDMWLGTDSGGVTVFRDQRFRKFGRNDGMPDDLVRCVFEDSHGTLWAGTNGYGLRRFNGHAFSRLTTADGLLSDVILSLAGDSHGDLFVGTPDGLNILHEGHIRSLTSADGLPDDFVRSLYEGVDDSLWIGTRRGLAHYVRGRIVIYTTANGLPSDLIGSILRGSNGCMWVGTLKGLACFADGKIVRPQFLASLGEDPVTALFEDRQGGLWIGMDGGGLARLKGQHTFEFPSNLGLPKVVSGIVEDSSGQLWITSPRGLFRASRAQLTAYADRGRGDVSVISYGTGDGLPVSEFSTSGHPAIWEDHASTIWLASAKGVVSIDAAHTALNRIPPSVVIEHVDAGNRLLDPSQVAALGPDLSRLSFAYTGLSFVAPQQIRFKYRLEGFDRAWIDAGTSRTASYTNLPPGNYRFVVLARNNDGFWSTQGASLPFRLRPHFYQTASFRSLLLLAFAAFAYLLYRWRVNYVRTQFKAVMAERNRIAREIHDTLAQGFVGVSVQLELACRLLATSAQSAAEVLDHTQSLVQDSLAEARRSIWNLRSVTGEDENLGSKLSRTVRQAVRGKPLDVKIEVTGAYRPLPAHMETEVLRIGQEAVTNVVRHANATRLDVSLAFDSTKAQMNISDNGRGFVPQDFAANPDGHFGLRGMRERAEAIKAKLSVTSAEGKGTQVCLELPLK